MADECGAAGPRDVQIQKFVRTCTHKRVHVCADRVYVYGGEGARGLGDTSASSQALLDSVEVLDTTQGWSLLPTRMFAGDAYFASVALP